jgi:hypothetical protein
MSHAALREGIECRTRTMSLNLDRLHGARTGDDALDRILVRVLPGIFCGIGAGAVAFQMDLQTGANPSAIEAFFVADWHKTGVIANTLRRKITALSRR